MSTARVDFTRGAAERIARVVRIVEGGDRNESPLSFGKVDALSGKVFRVCTFTGEWSISTVKTVTFKNQTATPNTVSVTNLFWPIPDGTTRDCAIAKEGSAWYLLVPQMFPADYATAATISTTAIEFKTLPGVAMATSGTVVFTIDITTCATATT